MEPQAPFKLTKALATWRRELESQSALTADNRRELEGHLMEGLAELQRHGLSAEEAFWITTRRLGSPLEVAAEYYKADPSPVWRDRVFWMAAGMLITHVFTNGAFLTTRALTNWFNQFGTSFGPWAGWLLSLAPSFLLVGAAFALGFGRWQSLANRLERCCSSFSRLAWTAAGLIVAVIVLQEPSTWGWYMSGAYREVSWWPMVIHSFHWPVLLVTLLLVLGRKPKVPVEYPSDTLPGTKAA